MRVKMMIIMKSYEDTFTVAVVVVCVENNNFDVIEVRVDEQITRGCFSFYMRRNFGALFSLKIIIIVSTAKKYLHHVSHYTWRKSSFNKSHKYDGWEGDDWEGGMSKWWKNFLFEQ